MASRSLILHRLTSHFAVRIKQNQRLLLNSRLHSCNEFPATIHMTADCVRRMKQLKAQDKVLRLRIELGERVGFRYVFDVVDDKTNPNESDQETRSKIAGRQCFIQLCERGKC